MEGELGQIKNYNCLASPPDLRIAPDLNLFFIFYFVKYNFSGVNKCVFKYTCAQDHPFSFPYPSKYVLALLRTVSPFPRDIKCKEVEGCYG